MRFVRCDAMPLVDVLLRHVSRDRPFFPFVSGPSVRKGRLDRNPTRKRPFDLPFEPGSHPGSWGCGWETCDRRGRRRGEYSLGFWPCRKHGHAATSGWWREEATKHATNKHGRKTQHHVVVKALLGVEDGTRRVDPCVGRQRSKIQTRE